MCGLKSWSCLDSTLSCPAAPVFVKQEILAGCGTKSFEGSHYKRWEDKSDSCKRKCVKLCKPWCCVCERVARRCPDKSSSVCWVAAAHFCDTVVRLSCQPEELSVIGLTSLESCFSWADLCICCACVCCLCGPRAGRGHGCGWLVFVLRLDTHTVTQEGTRTVLSAPHTTEAP